MKRKQNKKQILLTLIITLCIINITLFLGYKQLQISEINQKQRDTTIETYLYNEYTKKEYAKTHPKKKIQYKPKIKIIYQKAKSSYKQTYTPKRTYTPTKEYTKQYIKRNYIKSPYQQTTFKPYIKTQTQQKVYTTPYKPKTTKMFNTTTNDNSCMENPKSCEP